MKHTLLALTLLFSVSGAFAQMSEQAVKETFDKYKTAIIEDRPEEATSYLDSRSLEYTSDLIKLATSADRNTLSEQSLIDRFMVLAIRHKAPKEMILTGDVSQIMSYAINEGLIGKSLVNNNSIGAVTIDGDTAKGQLIMGGTPVDIFFTFRKEGSDWKLDMTSILPATQSTLESLQKVSGMEEDQYLMMVLQTFTKSMPSDSVWEPVLK